MKTTKLTRAEEKILAYVKECNAGGAFAGLSTDPEASNYTDPEFRFVRRLADRGEIVWMPRSAKFGAGWALRESVTSFYQRGYTIA